MGTAVLNLTKPMSTVILRGKSVRAFFCWRRVIQERGEGMDFLMTEAKRFYTDEFRYVSVLAEAINVW
jgi:hypothetical protein